MREMNGKYQILIPCPDGKEGCLVAHYAWLDVDAFNQIHDCYYDNYKRKPSASIVYQVYQMLPSEIKDLANEWGWNDTEVGEGVHKWMSARIVIF